MESKKETANSAEASEDECLEVKEQYNDDLMEEGSDKIADFEKYLRLNLKQDIDNVTVANNNGEIMIKKDDFVYKITVCEDGNLFYYSDNLEVKNCNICETSKFDSIIKDIKKSYLMYKKDPKTEEAKLVKNIALKLEQKLKEKSYELSCVSVHYSKKKDTYTLKTIGKNGKVSKIYVSSKSNDQEESSFYFYSRPQASFVKVNEESIKSLVNDIIYNNNIMDALTKTIKDISPKFNKDEYSITTKKEKTGCLIKIESKENENIKYNFHIKPKEGRFILHNDSGKNICNVTNEKLADKVYKDFTTNCLKKTNQINNNSNVISGNLNNQGQHI